MKQENGVYQLDNGKWAYRFSILVNGKRVTRRKSTDAQGVPLKTKKAQKPRDYRVFEPFDDKKELHLDCIQY